MLTSDPSDENLFKRILPKIEGGINQELLSDNHKSIGTELICTICLEIVFDPVMCSNCENLFCKVCIKRLLSKTNKCPNQCQFSEKEKNIMLKKLLNRIEFKCMYFKCGCTALVSYADFLNHINKCDYGVFQCMSPSCEYQNNRFEMQSHINVCPFREFVCSFCDEKHLRKFFDQHFLECGNKRTDCKYCKKGYLNKELQSHTEVCEHFELKCKDCDHMIKRINYPSHDSVQCLTNQVENWKKKCEEKQLIIEDLEHKLKEKEKLTTSIANFSVKLLENSGHNNHNNHFDLQSLSAAGLNHSSQPAVLDHYHPYDSHLTTNIANSSNVGSYLASSLNWLLPSLDNQPNISENVAQLYDLEQSNTLTGLSGLIYSIIDLQSYKPNLAACGSYCTIILFNPITCEKIDFLEGHTSYIWSLFHLKDFKSSMIASGSQDNSIKLWDLNTKACVRTLLGHTNWVTTLSGIKRDKNLLISASYDHTLRIWDLTNGECVKIISNVFGKSCLNAFYVNESYILHGSSGNFVVVYDTQTNTVKANLQGHMNLINCMVNLGEYKSGYIASGSDDKTIRIWDIQYGVPIKTLTGHTQCITSLEHLYNYDKAILASASDDHSIRLWNLVSFACVSIVNIHSSWVKSIVNLNSTSGYVMSHGDTGVIKLSKIVTNQGI